MIAAVSPSFMFYDDTYNTLKYANRAKDIKSSVSILAFIDLLSKCSNISLGEGLFLSEDYFQFTYLFFLNILLLSLLSSSGCLLLRVS